MYIPEFWAGVLVVLLSELLFVVIFSLVSTRKDKDENNGDKGNQ